MTLSAGRVRTDIGERTPDARRRARWRAHSWLREFSGRRGAKLCMQPGAFGEQVEVSVERSGRTHLSGIQRCGSVHACSLCAPVIREKRAAQLDVIFGRALAEGHHLYMLTATLQHSLLMPLESSLRALQEAWSAAFSGRAAQWRTELQGPVLGSERLQRFDYVGMVRALDFTCGDVNGWHPHVHAVLIFDRDTSEGDRAAFMAARGVSYRKALRKRGFYSAANSVGWHAGAIVNVADTAAYTAKVAGGWGAGLELARGDVKRSRHIDGTTPFELLRAAAVDGDADAGRKFLEYEAATMGRKLLTVSSRVKAMFGYDVKQLDADDTELAAAEPTSEVVYVKVYTASHWSWLVTSSRACAELEAVRAEARRLGFVDEDDPPDG